MTFTVGQEIEYGYPRDATVGGHWFACRIVALDLGRPLIVQVKNGRGEWMDPIRVTHRSRSVSDASRSRST